MNYQLIEKAAAWLHDMLEDVAILNKLYNEEKMREELDEEITQLVLQLTDVTKEEGGNRANRKVLDRQRLAAASDSVKTIKLADIIDNALNITEHDKHFSVVYVKEIEATLPFLTGGNSILYQIAESLIKRRRLNIFDNGETK